MKLFTKILFFLTFCSSFSQAPSINWMKRFGGTGNDLPRGLVQTLDGGCVVGGYSSSGISGIKTLPTIGYNFDYWIIKFNNLGVIEWQSNIGGGGTSAFTELAGEVFRGLSLSSDGGYFVTGISDSSILGNKTEPSYGSADFWVVKLNSSGQVLWDKTLGGNLYEECYDVKYTSDGGCIVGGESASNISGNKTENSKGGSDFWVIKLNALGGIEWQKTIGGGLHDSLISIVVTNDNQYLLGGSSSSNVSGDKSENSIGSSDYWIVKLNAVGTILWDKTIGGNSGDVLIEMVKTNSGFLLAGSSSSNISGNKTENSKGSSDFWLVNIDENGTILWDKTIGGSEVEYVNGIVKCPDNGFVIAGSSTSNISGDKTQNSQGGNDGWVVRINANGNILWDKTIGSLSDEGFNQVVALSDNSFVLSGTSYSSVSGDVTVPGYGGLEYWVVKLNQETLDTSDSVFSKYNFYPNPTSDVINIKFKENQELTNINLYNNLGQKIQNFSLENSSLISVPLNGSDGIYFLDIKGIDGISTSIKVLKKQ